MDCMLKHNDFIQLVAVQYKLDTEIFANSQKFAAKIESLMVKIRNLIDDKYHTLVVFPEDIGTMLILDGMTEVVKNSQSLKEGIEKFIKQNFLTIGLKKIFYRTSWQRMLFLHKSNNIAKLYFETFSYAARKHGVYIVAGSILLPDYTIESGKCKILKPVDSKIFNISYLFGPDGLIIGKQKKVYLTDLEGTAGLDAESAKLFEIKVFDTLMGKIGIAICLDAFKKDVLTELKNQGADILVQPSANPKEWDYEQKVDWLNGSWLATAKEKLFKYAVNPMMTGRIFDISFYGQSSIIASDMQSVTANYLELSATNGFVEISKSCDKEEIIIAKLPHPKAIR